MKTVNIKTRNRNCKHMTNLIKPCDMESKSRGFVFQMESKNNNLLSSLFNSPCKFSSLHFTYIRIYFLLNLNGQYFMTNIYLRILFWTSFQLFRYPIECRGTVEIHSYLLFTESDYCACWYDAHAEVTEERLSKCAVN